MDWNSWGNSVPARQWSSWFLLNHHIGLAVFFATKNLSNSWFVASSLAWRVCPTCVIFDVYSCVCSLLPVLIEFLSSVLSGLEFRNHLCEDVAVIKECVTSDRVILTRIVCAHL